ncbi:MAG: VWA domain-containing protein [Betaproteobacteria bacterium]|nr:VWA domain-containing protein [Betaproteobacteria bacterium]
MKSKSSIWLLTAMLGTQIAVSCSTADYGSAGDPAPKKTNAKAAPESTTGGSGGAKGENAAPQPKSKASPEFFSSGKSLDLHVIMDKSGSLWVDPNMSTVMGSGSDPECKRMDALLDLIDGLKAKLTKGEFVRLTVVTFSNGSAAVGSLPDVLKESRSSIDQKLRPGVCTFPGQLETTNYAEGISESLSELRRLRATKKLEVETSLFFSDGAAKDSPTRLLDAISELNAEFPKRIFGILLGNTSDQCTLSEGARRLSTIECLRKVVGNANEKVVQSDDAAGLSAAMTSLLEK